MRIKIDSEEELYIIKNALNYYSNLDTLRKEEIDEIDMLNASIPWDFEDEKIDEDELDELSESSAEYEYQEHNLFSGEGIDGYRLGFKSGYKCAKKE